MGRQPFGLASPAAWLRREGVEVRVVDAAKEKLHADDTVDVDLVAFHLPMHTATRLAAPVIRSVRADARTGGEHALSAHLCLRRVRAAE